MIEIVKRKGTKKKPTSTKGKMNSMDQMIYAIESLPYITNVITGKVVKANKNWKGPGFYLKKSEQDCIDLYVVGNTPGSAVPIKVCYGKGNRNKALKKLIDFRLDGYGKGRISSDSYIGLLQEYIKSVPGIIDSKTIGLQQRSSPWKGPGFYQIKYGNNADIETILIGKTENIGLAIRLRIDPSQRHNIEYELNNYRE